MTPTYTDGFAAGGFIVVDADSAAIDTDRDVTHGASPLARVVASLAVAAASFGIPGSANSASVPVTRTSVPQLAAINRVWGTSTAADDNAGFTEDATLDMSEPEIRAFQRLRPAADVEALYAVRELALRHMYNGTTPDVQYEIAEEDGQPAFFMTLYVQDMTDAELLRREIALEVELHAQPRMVAASAYCVVNSVCVDAV